MLHSPLRLHRHPVVTALACTAMLAGIQIVADQRPAAAATVTAVRGEACSYWVSVGLFGGPPTLRGCGEPGVTHSSVSYAATATLPSGGSGSPISDSDADGAKAQYGPAVIFGGEWPCDPGNCPLLAPPSGPQAASTQGTLGGTVTSSADIVLFPTDQRPKVRCDGDPAGTTNCFGPGGYGPHPVFGDELHVTCSANDTAVTGSTSLVNSVLATSTDGDGSPLDTEVVPDNPPVNYTRSGVITNVGDVFTVVYNEQIHNADGSLTVNGAHMYLFGPTAVGEVVKGSVTCGVTMNPPGPTPVDTVAPTCGTPVVAPNSPTDPTPKSPRTELIGVFDAGLGRSARTFGDGATATGSTTLTSPSAGFSASDIGAAVGGPTIQPGATIASVPNATTAIMSVGAAGTSTPTASVTITRQKGLQSISNIHVINGTVKVGTDPNDPIYASGHPPQTLVFTPGQTWPLPVNAIRTTAAETAGLPLIWSFDATDVAGHVTHCQGVFRPSLQANYDGDLRTDISVLRPGGNTWFVRPSSGAAISGTPYGASGDLLAPADYDGDNKADIAIFRPSTGLWAIHRSGGGADTFVTYGVGGDIPVPADYDGDGKADIAIYRPSTGTWWVHRTSTNTDTATTFGGISGDVPVPADYDGDGKVDVAIFRKAAGNWFVRPSLGGPDTVATWGLNGDVPVVGDFDGDGKADNAIFRPSTGLWAIHKSSGVGDTSVTYGGIAGDIPVVGDYDGDGATDIAIFRPSLGAWYQRWSSSGADVVVTFGVNGDIPLALPTSVRLAFF